MRFAKAVARSNVLGSGALAPRSMVSTKGANVPNLLSTTDRAQPVRWASSVGDSRFNEPLDQIVDPQPTVTNTADPFLAKWITTYQPAVGRGDMQVAKMRT